MSSKKLTIDLSQVEVRPRNRNSCAPTRGGNMVVLPGYGDKTFQFPGVEEVVIKALERINAASVAQTSAAGSGGATTTGAKRRTTRQPNRLRKASGTEFGAVRIPVAVRDDEPAGSGLLEKRSTIPALPINGEQSTHGFGSSTAPAVVNKPLLRVEGADSTLFAATEGIRLILFKGRFDALVAERFDPLSGAVNWAREHLDAKYQPCIASLATQLTRLQELYKTSLPRVLIVLQAQNPNAPQQLLLHKAVDGLDQEMIRILTVLRIWTDAFGQLRDGMYKQLQAVVFTVEQAFKLFETGDLEGSCKGSAECKPRLKTSVFNIGNVFVARFSPQGPATLPGTAGPVGAHAIEVPHDERYIITLMLVLYAHEFRHDIFADVEGLAEELTQAVLGALVTEWQKGNLKLSSEKTSVGKAKVATIELLAKLFGDNIGEVDADINGGVSLCGYAFAYNMVSTFGALNSRSRNVFDSNQLLRTGSYYELSEPDENGRASLRFEAHPPDYIRAYICAAALDEIGFSDEAATVRRLADQAVGEIPEYITWEDSDPKSKDVIRIKVEDLKAAAPIVVRALMHTKLESLGGASCYEIVNWDRKRQEKVDQLRANLVNGTSEVPDSSGDFFATYVAAAASLAYWDLCKLGVRPVQAAESVEYNALRMLDTVRERLSQPAIAPKVDAAASDCGCEGEPRGGDTPAKPGSENGQQS